MRMKLFAIHKAFPMRRGFLLLAIIFSLSMVFAACTNSSAPALPQTAVPSPSSSAQTITLTVGLATDTIITLDPAAYSDRATETVIRNIFDGLVTRTVDNEIVPELAQQYRWIDDETVEFTLKQNVQFHNGDVFTAQDVVFTFDRLLNQEVGAPRRVFVQGIEQVEAIDEYTVRFHLHESWPVFLQALVHTQIVPQAYLREVGAARFAQNPIGTGPYQFVSGELNDEIVLVRFADYYGGADALPPLSPPLLDYVVFRMMPDTTARLQALTAEDLQIIQDVPSGSVPQLLNNPNVIIKTTIGTRPKILDFNITQPPFNDVRVRQAISYAIDADALLQEVAGGYGILMAGPLSPANQYVDHTLPLPEYDLQKAQILLSEAGYTPEEIIFTLDTLQSNVLLAERIAAQLNELGMQVEVAVWQMDQLRPLLLSCQRQAFIHDWGDSIFDPVGYIEAKWQTQQPGTSAGRGNYACYSNPDVDELITSGAVVSDPEQRHEIYNEAQRLISEDVPSLFLYVPQEIEASSSQVRNWQPSPDNRINLHDVWLAGLNSN